MRVPLPLGVVACLLVGGTASAAVLGVGPQAEHPSLDAAIRAARDGDTIHLGPGTYYECAVVTRRNLVLEGEGPATVITDMPCQGKALIVAAADNLVVRDLTLARVRVPDGNGAGIRMEAAGLRVERVRFENDERGILAAQSASGTLVVQDCVFSAGGVAGERPGYALAVGGIGLLRVERSVFEGVKGGQIATAADRTELVGNTIGTGAEPEGGYAVSAGGSLLMQGNTLILGPAPSPRGAAILAKGVEAVLSGNRLRNETGKPATLLLDWTSGSPRLDGNVIGAGDTLTSRDGVMRNRAANLVRDMAGDLRQAAGRAKQALKAVVGR